MKTSLFSILVAIILITPINTLFAQGDKSETLTIKKIAIDTKFNGVGLIATGGKISLLKDYHINNMPGEPHNVGTKFNIGSIGKVFTAVAIGQLVDKGILSFDDTIKSHMPHLPESFENIKISHLLTHMSGIGNFFQPIYRDKIYSFKKISDIMEIILSEPHAFSPGEKMQYSNSGFVVLGALIEEITGQSYEAYIQKNVFDLAKMNSTSFTIDDKTATNYSKGMMRTSGGDNASKPLQKSRTRRALPAGGMFSTAEDLYNFAIALINNDLMSEKTTKIMTSAKPGTIRKSRSTGKDVGYGYGFNVSQDGLRIGHGGGGPGINAELIIWPQTQNIIITLTNLDPPLASNFANKIENYIKNKTSQNLK